ncbi:Glioma tumor suppressor candidate region protein 2 [Rhizophlyctis rosea]|uniref:Ribosome biogenesis protein NOP53 n=1 Tax=Rhizophlyctis rosea TaxID=64517 RepID=A0AAD5SEX8_9FUNG|nr:Glioma tumor suppressor candidate region protein 2 [Rhizophlyctis rosea]
MAPSTATKTKKSAQPSRKGKKAWRKNTDVGDVEEQLDELRNEVRLGGKIHEKTDDQLFFTDKTGDAELRKKRQNRPLRIEEILKPQSAFDGIRSRPTASSSKSAPPTSIGKVREVSKTIANKIEDLAKRKREEGLGPGSTRALKRRRLDEKKAELKKAKGGFDLWDVEDTTQANDDGYLEPVAVKQVKKPKLPVDRPTAIQAVEITHAGTSYNPTFEDHQAALQVAIDVELAKEKSKAETAKKMSYPAELDELDDETFFDDSEDEEDDLIAEEDIDGGRETDGAMSEAEDGRSHVKPVVSESRKTRAQRNKEARNDQKRREELKAKEEKKLAKQLNRLSELKKQVTKEETARQKKLEEKAKAEAEAAATLTRRVGPHEFKAAPMEIQLTEELADTLRELKPEGNLFQDRFLSLQKRSLIETRVPVSKRLKYKRKEMESHDYKRFK